MLRSIVIVPLAVIITFFLSAFVVVMDIFSPSQKRSRSVARLWAKILLRITGTKIHVIGLENVIPDKPQIFMANHQSEFDILIFLAVIPADFLWVAKKELFDIPVFGTAMKKAGYIAVDRKDHIRAMKSVEESAQRLKEGMSIATFPEGTRSREGKLLPFKQGMFYLAIQTGAPITPVSIIGSGRIMPTKTLKINKGHIDIVITKPQTSP